MLCAPASFRRSKQVAKKKEVPGRIARDVKPHQDNSLKTKSARVYDRWKWLALRGRSWGQHMARLQENRKMAKNKTTPRITQRSNFVLKTLQKLTPAQAKRISTNDPKSDILRTKIKKRRTPRHIKKNVTNKIVARTLHSSLRISRCHQGSLI